MPFRSFGALPSDQSLVVRNKSLHTCLRDCEPLASIRVYQRMTHRIALRRLQQKPVTGQLIIRTSAFTLVVSEHPNGHRTIKVRQRHPPHHRQYLAGRLAHLPQATFQQIRHAVVAVKSTFARCQCF